MKDLKGSIFAIIIITLIMPFEVHCQSVLVKLDQTQEISLFSKAMVDSGLDTELKDDATYTIFAPSNTVLEKEIGDKNYSASRLKAFLLNHIMTGWATEKNLKSMSKATTMGGITLEILWNGTELKINDAKVLSSNIKASNGVIHIIDKALK